MDHAQITSPGERNIVNYIDAHRDEMMSLWETLVSNESPSTEKAEVDRVGTILANELTDAGAVVHIEEVTSRGNLICADWNNGSAEAPIILCGHMDTVFPKGTLHERPFHVTDGKAYGPGVLDMKGGLVIALYVLKALAHSGYCGHPIRVIFAGDEETGHRQSDIKDRLPKLVRGAAAALNFETGFPSDGLVVGRKGSCRLSLDVTGVSAHAGNCPEDGRNAILEMAHKIVAIQNLNDLTHGTSVNVGIISGGTVVNAIPGHCHIDIDIRYTNRTLLEQTLQAIQAIADTNTVDDCSCKLTMQSISVVMETNDSITHLFEHIRKTALDIGYGEVSPMHSGGWSDANLIANAGVPVICGMGVKGEFNHTPREYAIVESLFQRAKLAAISIFRTQ